MLGMRQATHFHRAISQESLDWHSLVRPILIAIVAQPLSCALLSGLAASGMYPLFDQMMDQKVLKTNSFGFFLSNKVSNPGKLVLGETGAKKYYKGELTAHDVSA